jgi:hypothetical protein
MRCISLRTSLIVTAACLWAGVAWALINPRFTPKELFKQSQMILVVDVKEGNAKDEYLLTTRDVLKKGTTDEKVIRLDISKARDERAADLFRKLAASGRPGLFFVGAYGSNPGGPEKRGLLHLDGQWASCVANSDGVWLYDTLDDALQAARDGGELAAHGGRLVRLGAEAHGACAVVNAHGKHARLDGAHGELLDVEKAHVEARDEPLEVRDHDGAVHLRQLLEQAEDEQALQVGHVLRQRIEVEQAPCRIVLALVLQVLEPVDVDSNNCDWKSSNTYVDIKKEG